MGISAKGGDEVIYQTNLSDHRKTFQIDVKHRLKCIIVEEILRNLTYGTRPEWSFSSNKAFGQGLQPTKSREPIFMRQTHFAFYILRICDMQNTCRKIVKRSWHSSNKRKTFSNFLQRYICSPDWLRRFQVRDGSLCWFPITAIKLLLRWSAALRRVLYPCPSLVLYLFGWINKEPLISKPAII